MAKDEGWGRRLRSARRAYEERHDGGLTYGAIGKRLGERLNRPAFKHSTVRAWFADGQEPDSFAVARALEEVLEAAPGSLIIGETKTPPKEEGGSGSERPVVQPGPTVPSAKDTADFIRLEQAAARAEDAQARARDVVKKVASAKRGRGPQR